MMKNCTYRISSNRRACPSIFQPLSGGARLLEHARQIEHTLKPVHGFRAMKRVH
jgi:hypothetical protein